MTADYLVHVGGIGRTIETVKLEEDGDRQAVFTAFRACSPFGHSLWKGRRFLGYFEAGEGRFPDPSRSWASIAEGAGHGASR